MSRQAILDAINKTITRSEQLTEQVKARNRGTVAAAFSGAGFSSETATKMAMVKGIRPNRGFKKGGIASQFQEIDPELDQFHNAPASAADFASDPDGAISHFNAPGGVHGGYDGSAASDDSAFTAPSRTSIR